jgi:hypothetical protein
MSNDATRGLYRKYDVKRTDGSSGPGGKHEHCAYFVLDLEHDEFAIPALMAYRDAARKSHPQLAEDIDAIVQTQHTKDRAWRCGCREAACPHSLGQALMPNASEQATRIMGRRRR